MNIVVSLSLLTLTLTIFLGANGMPFLSMEEFRLKSILKQIVNLYFDPGLPIFILNIESYNAPAIKTLTYIPICSNVNYLTNAILKDLNKEIDWPLIMLTIKEEIHHSFNILTGKKLMKTSYFIIVIFLETEEDIFVIAECLFYIKNRILRTSSASSNIHYLVVINFSRGNFPDISYRLRMQIQELNDLQMFHNIVMLYPDWQQTKDFDVHIVSSTPRKSMSDGTKCGLQNLNILETKGELFENITLYSKVSKNDIKECTIYAVPFSENIIPGIVNNCVTEISKPIGLHVKLNYEMIGYPLIMYDIYSDFHYLPNYIPLYSSPLISINTMWYVPCGKQLARQGNIIKVFQWPVWVSMLLVFLVAVFFVFWVFKVETRRNELVHYMYLSTCFYKLWAIVVGVAAPDISHTTNMRIFIILWILYCYSMSTIFQAFFASFLIEPGSSKQILSLKELSDANINKISKTVILDYWCLEHSQTHKDMCKSVTQTNDSLINYFIETILEMLRNILPFEDSFCYIEDSRKYYFYGAIFGQDNVFFEQFNRMTLLMWESGLIENLLLKQENNFRNKKTNNYSNYIAHQSSNIQQYFVLKLSHLQLTFYILILGNCAAFFIFMI
ncbi:hypothetical protein L9F63_019902, partial [Diploptera punctata]